MRISASLITALLAAALLSHPSRLQAEEAPTSLGPAERWVETRRVERLEASLVEVASADRTIRTWGGVASVVLGAALIAGGVVVAVGDDGWGDDGRAAVSGISWAAGASLISVGIYRWLTPSPAEERLERWTALRYEKRLDIFEFARFEGELASEAATAKFARRFSAFGSLGLIAGGAGMIAFAASSELEGDSETGGYVMGGVLAGVGVIQLLALLLRDSPAERAWQHYAEGGGGLSLHLRDELGPLRL
ncbi:MAG TPA: hypothetical protein VJR89_25975 [Polyangiales bacterium]|nr:hypothetical protein [Polyangiales bacterium]